MRNVSYNKASVDTIVVFKSIEQKAKPIITKLNGLEIKTKADYDKAASLLKDLKALGKDGKAKLNGIIDPAKTIIANAKALFKPFETSLATVEASVKAGMLAFVESQNKKRERLEADFESGKIARPQTYLNKTAALDVDNTRNAWALVEVDANLTPREYLTPDLAKIKEALKEGKKVKGWKYEQQQTIVI